MKQEDFIEQIERENIDKIIIPVCWIVDEHKRVIVDYEGMKKEFENKLKRLLEISNSNIDIRGLK